MPDAKEKLEIFKEAVTKLRMDGDLRDVGPLDIECDERWINKRKSILMDSLQSDRQRSARAIDEPVRKRIESRTFGENPKKRARLGIDIPRP